MSYLTHTLDLGVLGEVDVCVHYKYTKGTPATMYDSNGDPGDPGDPEELDVVLISSNVVEKIKEHLLASNEFMEAVRDNEEN